MATVFSTSMKGPLAVKKLNEMWDLAAEGGGGGGAAAWGGIVGVLGDQTDLSESLNDKVSQEELDEALAAVLTNPMTAVWDLIVGGAVTGGKAAPARLAKGADGQVLKMVAGAVVWAAPAAAIQCLPIACSDETTLLTAGAAKVTFRMPYAMTLTAVRASVTTAPTGSALTADVNKGGASILSTKLTIDAGEKSSVTAAAHAVISDSALADDSEITIDIDGIGSTVAGAGLKVYLMGVVA